MIRLRLFTKLFLTLALATILLIWLVKLVSDYTEVQLSTIATEHQKTLKVYAQQASHFLKQDDVTGLKLWAGHVKEKENTWLAVMKTEPTWLVGEYDEVIFYGETDFTIGRDMKYPIHLYYSQNPVMKVAIPDTKYNLLIQLPQRMRPGAYWQVLNTSIRLGFPILLVALMCAVIYRHIISPIKSMHRATHQVSLGDFDVRLDDTVSNRHDELGELANSFNTMTKRIGVLVGRQRQLIQDISHELRTPITRIKLVLDGEDKNPAFIRVEQEVNGMQRLLEDTLTLSWLNNENTQVVKESVDLTPLIDSICEDANFEFSRKDIIQDTPKSCVIHNSNHRAIGQALENIIRNAMKYTNIGTPVNICVKTLDDDGLPSVRIEISDCGSGIKGEYLEEIFEPFFRIDSSRDKTTSGYGLGLALTKRQIEAVGGVIYAQHNKPCGLCFVITLPRG